MRGNKIPIEEMGTGTFCQFVGNELVGKVLDYLDDMNAPGSVKDATRSAIRYSLDRRIKPYLKHRIRVLEHQCNRDLGSEQEPDEVTEFER